ncbi:MAG: DUF4402 domain-containing protein [Bacteroidales bacterium]
MKTMLKFFTFVAVLFGFSSISFAQGTQSTASATAVAGGRIIQPLKLIATKALEFGDIIKGENTVTVAANGSRTATNTDLLLTLTSGGKTPQAAEFEIEGEPGLAYVVTYESNVVLNGPDSATMSVGSFTTNATLTLPDDSIEETTAGKDTFNVGASLTVSADQKPGVYEGTFTVTVNYN